MKLAFDDFQYWIPPFCGYPMVQLIDLDAAMRQGDNPALVEQIAQRLPLPGGRRHWIDREGARCWRRARGASLSGLHFSTFRGWPRNDEDGLVRS